MCERCNSQPGILSEYLDGELDSCLCEEIERHMAECGDCRIMVDTLRKTVILYREHGHEEMPADTKARLYAILQLRPRSAP